MPEAAADDLDALVLAALAERVRIPSRLPEHVARLRQRAGSNARGQALADLVQGWAAVHANEHAQAERMARQALEICRSLNDTAGAARALDVLAASQLATGQLDAVGPTLAPILAMARTERAPIDWCFSFSRLSKLNEVQGRFDDALRWHYRGLAAARESGDAALEATSLGGLGGLQLSLQNLDEAATLLQAAWQLVGKHGHEWAHTWAVVATNLMMAFDRQGRFEEALPLADALASAAYRMSPQSRGKCKLFMAFVYARAGQPERSQPLIDEALALEPPNAAPPVEWVWAQAQVWNRQQRHADVLRICAAHHEAVARGALAEAPFPQDLVHLYDEATLAHEALGDAAAALRAQRAMIAAERKLVSMATRARRTTLQIQYELAAVERERDEARRREQASALEQARLAEMNAALHQANEAKTRFLAAASHDLRQPVAALNMYMAAIKLEGDAARREGLMQRMEQSLHALGGLFDALLDVSRLDAGLVSVNAAPLRLDHLLERLVAEHRLRAQERGLGLRLHLPSYPLLTSPLSLPLSRPLGAPNAQRARSSNAPPAPNTSARPTAHTDAALLERCLRNLIDNALKYTAHGGVVVRLRALSGAEPPAWRIEVRDTGPGIAPELHQPVFEEFFQIGNAERDRARGLGLGLSIVRRVSALLGHGLGLASRPGRGSCFHLTLPQHDALDDAVPTAAKEPAAAGPRLAVIVIDDDAAVRDSLGALLQRWGHLVLSGDSASAALAAWRRAGRPALDGALVDLRLRGGANGLEAIAQVRQHTAAAHLPALIITGDITPPRLALLEAAAQPWLPKPLLPMPLRSWLQTLRPRAASAPAA